MYTTDKRMIRLAELLIFEKKISGFQEFYNAADIAPQTISKIKKGINHFTIKHIENVLKKYNVNANWLFGNSPAVYNHKNTIHLD